jgi:cationic peptide transport system ATP-binding protein
MDLINVENIRFEDKISRLFTPARTVFSLGPVNFDLQAGETLAIIGDNGSGKSLLAKLLVGLETPSSGKILLNGLALSTAHHKQKCHDIRMIFQNSTGSLNPGITVGAMLEEPLILNTELNVQERLSKIDNTLRLVGLLDDHKFFYRHMLSDGQKQRVALAKALILDPKVIVADEPFAALDPSVRSQTVNLLMGLQRDLGLGFIFISHNLGIVRHVADKILVMENGAVIESGKTDVIFNWPKEDYTKRLIETHQQLVNSQYN